MCDCRNMDVDPYQLHHILDKQFVGACSLILTGLKCKLFWLHCTRYTKGTKSCLDFTFTSGLPPISTDGLAVLQTLQKLYQL